MLGVIFSLLAAGTFAMNAAAARRAVLTGSVLQGLAITIPLGVPLFFAVAWMAGDAGHVIRFPAWALFWFSLAGIVHFVGGRYCNYAANGAIGTNLSAPIMQTEVLITLALAMLLLGEYLTPLRLIGIVLVLIGPSLVFNRAPPTTATPPASSSLLPPGNVEPRVTPVFEPRYYEGYVYAALAAVAYGTSPILIGLGLRAAGTTAGSGAGAALAGGVVSYIAATVVICAFLVVTGRTALIFETSRTSRRWFLFAGVFVCLSHIFRYAALGLAPVSVVTTLQRLSSIFRIYFGWAINREHEVFDRSVILATVVSMVGAIALSVSTEVFLSLAEWPDWVCRAALWRWP